MTQQPSELCLVQGDLPQRVQRRLGLMPARGLGAFRRAAALAAFSWLPLVLGNWLVDHGIFGVTHEPLPTQLGVHARCLIALPMFVLCELSAERASAQWLRHLRRSQLATPHDLQALVDRFARLRSSDLPWQIIALLVLAWTARAPLAQELLGGQPPTGRLLAQLGFAALWYLYVVLPLFGLLLLGWVWRILLCGFALLQISRLPLALVPTHPDRAFGLGFFERAPAAFIPFFFGASSVLSASFAHDVLYHGVPAAQFRLPAVVFVGLVSLFVLVPLCAFALPLSRKKLASLPEYGALVSEYGRKVQERWILRREPDAPELLAAPELGPVADTLVLFHAVAGARVVPIGRITLLLLIVPLVLPLLLVVLCQMPLGDVLQAIYRALV